MVEEIMKFAAKLFLASFVAALWLQFLGAIHFPWALIVFGALAAACGVIASAMENP